MQLYTSEEELNLLKVLVTILKNQDIKRLGDVALNILQKNPNSPIAKTLYYIDLNGFNARYNDDFNEENFGESEKRYDFTVPHYKFNTTILNNFLKEIIADTPRDDEESVDLIIDLINMFVIYCAYSAADINVSTTIKLLFECFFAFNPDKEAKTAFYTFATKHFCEVYNLYKSSGVIQLKPDDVKCITNIKHYIFNDAEVDNDVKNSLVSKLNKFIMPSRPTPQIQPEPQQSHKTRNIVIGVIAVVGVIVLILSLL